MAYERLKLTFALVTSLLTSAAFQAQAQEREQVSAIIAGAINNAAPIVAAENVYWRNLGLDVNRQTLDTGSQVSRALLSGSADVGAGNATSSVPLSGASGSNLTFVRPYQNNPLVVNGADFHKVILLRVPDERLEALSRLYWIKRIEPETGCPT